MGRSLGEKIAVYFNIKFPLILVALFLFLSSFHHRAFAQVFLIDFLVDGEE